MSTVTARRWAVGDAVVTRVPEAGFDLVLPQDEATTRLLAKASWLASASPGMGVVPVRTEASRCFGLVTTTRR